MSSNPHDDGKPLRVIPVKEIFSLAPAQREEGLRRVVRWVFANEDPESISASLLSREEVCRGLSPRQLQLEDCLEGELLYRIAFNFEEPYNNQLQ